MQSENYLLLGLGLFMQMFVMLGCVRSIKNNDPAISAVYFMVMYGVGLFSFLPAAYSFITGVAPSYMQELRPGSLSIGTIVEGLYWLAFYLALQFSKNSFLGNITARTLNDVFPSALFSKVMLLMFPLCVAGYFYLDPEMWELGFRSADNVFTARYERSTLAGILNPFGVLCLPITATLIHVSYFKNNLNNSSWRTIRYICFAVLVGSVMLGFAMGGRGILLLLGTILFVVVRYEVGLGRALTLLITIGAVGIIISPVIMAYKLDDSLYLNKTFEERLQFIFEGAGSTETRAPVMDAIEGVIFRIDGVHNGGNLIRYSDENGFVYLAPYVNSALSFIPRVLWADKPQPKSADGTVLTTPNILTGQISDRPVLTTSVSPSGVAYWQFGLLGVVICAVLQAFLTRALINVASDNGRSELLIFFWFLLNTTDIFLNTFFLIVQWVVPLMVLFFFIKLFTSRAAGATSAASGRQ